MADVGASERDQLLRQRIVGTAPDDFEQLVFELVRCEEPTAERIKAPDGGADVLRPQTQQQPSKVWQAKRYTGDINWEECEASLVRAVGRWSPEEIVFVFARDLSEVTEASFTTRLAGHRQALENDVSVIRWGLSELVRRLSERNDLRVRFFGQDLEPMWQALNRTISAGGALQSAEDLVQRAKTLSEWAAQQDKRFTQAVVASEVEAPEPKWEDLPFMTLQIADPSTRVNIATWPREGAEVSPPIFGFLESEDGARARLSAIRQLARGESARITEGARVQMDAPEVVRALAPGHVLETAEMSLSPGDPVPFAIEIPRGDGAVMTRSIEMYNVPPPPGGAGALAGYAGSVLVQAIIRLREQPRISLELQLSGQFAGDLQENADAAELLLAFYEEREGTLRSELLFPGGELTAPLHDEPDQEKLRELQILNSLFGSLVFIQDQLGITLMPPPEVSPEDVDALLTVRRVLETGEGTATFEGMSGMVDNPQEIAWLAEKASGSIQQRPVVYEVFDRQLTLGTGAYQLPQLKVVEVIPYGQAPDAPARVVMAADGDPEMKFRLVG
jgi:hypothetical protein